MSILYSPIYIYNFTTIYKNTPQKSELLFDIFDTSSDYQ